MIDFGELREVLESKLAEALDTQGEMVNRWVVLVETIDADGDRSLNKVSSDTATSWDSIGMLSAALALYKAEAQDYFEED